MFGDVQYREVFEYFAQLCAVPHGSGNTKGIADFLVDFAQKHALKYHRDAADNVIIYKAAAPGCEGGPTVILQGHSDMVCDSVGAFDFDVQPIALVRKGEVLSANGTTLGADNGIAGAMMLSILADDSVAHPALECVFTSDEEIGMVGALQLDFTKLSGKIMLNLDSDGEGIITCGCAGGASCHIRLPALFEKNSLPCYHLKIDGLLGGHSGVEIHKNRANAIKLAAKLIREAYADARIVNITGGSKENAIPSVAEVVFASAATVDFAVLRQRCEAYVKENYADNVPHITLQATVSETAMDADSSGKLLALLCEMPTGVVEMSKEMDDLVQTSLNCGVIQTAEDCVMLDVSVRSNVKASKAKVISNVKAIAEKYGALVTTDGEYPSWEYNAASEVKQLACEAYQALFGKIPQIEVIHAGLECGVFFENIPGLDCISFGPLLQDIHTVKECVEIGSVCRTYAFLLALLKEICAK